MADTKNIPSFVDYAWRRFDPRQAIEIIRGDKNDFLGQREILFTGLCLWILTPHRQDLIRIAMRLVGMRLLAQAERRRLRGSGINDFASTLISHMEVGERFYKEFYYPTGGLKALVDSPSTKELSTLIRREIVNLEHAHRMIEIISFHQNELEHLRGFDSASINKSAEAVRASYVEKNYKDRSPSIATCRKAWYRYRKNISVSFCVSNRFDEASGISLLELIVRQKAIIGKHFELLIEAIDAAPVIESTILNRLEEKIEPTSAPVDLSTSPSKYLPFSMASFSPQQIEALKADLSRRGGPSDTRRAWLDKTRGSRVIDPEPNGRSG